jgi:hypothetical protein
MSVCVIGQYEVPNASLGSSSLSRKIRLERTAPDFLNALPDGSDIDH